ncbi:MAG TPA: HAMP domain-containing sensor histidine kinase [Gammaproteobacteria bacterium]
MSAVDIRKPAKAASARRDSAIGEAGEFGWRILGLLNVFRLALGAILLAAFLLVDSPRLIGDLDPAVAFRALVAMLAVGCVEMWLLYRRTPRVELQTYLLFGADLAVVVALIHASGAQSNALGGLLAVSVGALALLVPLRRAFFFAAITTLALLLEQTFAHLRGVSGVEQYAAAGILGVVVFLITAVAQLVRRRIVETEALAEQRSVDLRNLVELNEYIIQHLRESIVVVDGDDRVRLINESALKHLGASGRTDGLPLRTLSPELVERLGEWRREGAVANGSGSPFAAADGSTTIQPHFAPLGSSRAGGVVIFLEDVSLIAERVQQTKLAALGRLSASIAHEIRNPIGAMSHAGQLLAESESIGAEDRRLTDIIRVNAKRVSQIVESVLSLSRREKARPERLLLKPWMHDFANEFVQTQELYEGAVSVTPDSVDVEVEMDPTHLHQIVWNLCENAVKYASATAGAIAVDLTCGQVETTGRPFLQVGDRGPGIDPAQAEQIFEPFFTGQPGGTGLGLYVCRELCERNGATLRYFARPGGGSQFRIVFADPNRWQTAHGAEAQ